VYVPTGKCIYDFDRIVAKGSTDDAFALRVEREMIYAASHVR
jgi:hypothetical protein